MTRSPDAIGLSIVATSLRGGSLTDVGDERPTLAEVIDTLDAARAVTTPNLVIAGTTLLGLAAGIVGVFALLRKRSLMTDALSHATLPGIVIAFIVASALRRRRALAPGGSSSAQPISGVLGVRCHSGSSSATRG